MPYSPTVYVNGTTPAINATDLNKLRNELLSQATARGVANSLSTFTWANGIAPAVSDSAQLNEMERVAQAVAATLAIAAYTPTAWSAGWIPPRNAVNLNHLENQAQANRAAIDALPPPSGTAYDLFTKFHGPFGDNEMFINRWSCGGAGTGPCGYQTLTQNGPNWSSIGGPSITEISTPYGGGFRFQCRGQMYHNNELNNGTNKSTFIADVDNIVSENGYEGAIVDLYLNFMLPSAGNPNGFANWSGWNCLWEWHPGGSFPVNNQLGIAPVDLNLNPFPGGPQIYVRANDRTSGGTQRYAYTPVIYDHWYVCRWYQKFTTGVNGFTQFTIDGNMIANWTGQTVQVGSAVQPNFGYYTGSGMTPDVNEVRYGGIIVA